MSDMMTHDEARERLEDLALELLDGIERGRVLAHIAGCSICRTELDALERTVSELTYAVRPVSMSTDQRERVRARLLARARADLPAPSAAKVSVAPHSPAQLPRRSRFTRSAWLAAAASVIAVLSVGAMMKMHRERAAMLAERDSMIATLTGPNIAVMKLAPATPRAPSGMMFWDQARGEWTLVAHNLRMPDARHGYQLWLVTRRAKISGGMFIPDVHGDAMMRLRFRLARDSLAALAVTEEPRSGSPQPTTPPLMVASAASR